MALAQVNEWCKVLRFEQEVSVTVRVTRRRQPGAVNLTWIPRRVRQAGAALASCLEAAATVANWFVNWLKWCSRSLHMRAQPEVEVYEGTGAATGRVEANSAAYTQLKNAWQHDAEAELLRNRNSVEMKERKENEERGHILADWLYFCVTRFSQELRGLLAFRQPGTTQELQRFVAKHVALASTKQETKEEYVLGVDTEGKQATYMQIAAGDVCDTVVFRTTDANVLAVLPLLKRPNVVIAVVGDELKQLQQVFKEPDISTFAAAIVDVQKLEHGVSGPGPSLAYLVTLMCEVPLLSKFKVGATKKFRSEAYAGFERKDDVPLGHELLLYAALDAIATNLLYKRFKAQP